MTWRAIALGALLGALAGAALSDLSPRWAWVAAVGAGIGATAAAIAALGHRRQMGTPATVIVAGAVAGIQGLLGTYVVRRGDSELADPLVVTSVMAVGLGLVCAGIAAVLLDDSTG